MTETQRCRDAKKTQADEMTLIQANGRKFQSAGGTGRFGKLDKFGLRGNEMKNTFFVAPEACWFCSPQCFF
jgi:hypothetical protein